MVTSDDVVRGIKQRDAMLRDAYHGRNGLSMSEAERSRYREQQAAARRARATMRKILEQQAARLR